MADVFTKRVRSQVMAAIRSKGNKATELKLAAILRANGIKGWRRHESLPGKPDFSFKRDHLAVFVDGCFWHGCATHCRMPSSNASYWSNKIARNKARDRKRARELAKVGWKTMQIWEHELRMPRRVAAKIISTISQPRVAK